MIDVKYTEVDSAYTLLMFCVVIIILFMTNFNKEHHFGNSKVSFLGWVGRISRRGNLRKYFSKSSNLSLRVLHATRPISLRNRKKSSIELTTYLAEGSVVVHSSTIRGSLLKSELKGCVSAIKTLLRKGLKTKRLQYTQ